MTPQSLDTRFNRRRNQCAMCLALNPALDREPPTWCGHRIGYLPLCADCRQQVTTDYKIERGLWCLIAVIMLLYIAMFLFL